MSNELKNYVSKEEVEAAKRIDLFSYLNQYDPDELKHIANGVYCTKTHDSLKISNGKWYWWSKNIGGRTALDYLIKVKGLGFVQAVRQLCGNEITVDKPISPTPNHQKDEYKETANEGILIPEPDNNNDKVIDYLSARGIDEALINQCIEDGILYQSKQYKNCCFVGKDENNEPRHIVQRSSYLNSVFVGETRGSQKAYSFNLKLGEDTSKLHIFESAIDLLSYVTLCKMDEKPCEGHFLSLSGITTPTAEKPMYMPNSLKRMLENNPVIREVKICFDNDSCGIKAAKALKQMLDPDYDVKITVSGKSKDLNELLMKRKELDGVAMRRPVNEKTAVEKAI